MLRYYKHKETKFGEISFFVKSRILMTFNIEIQLKPIIQFFKLVIHNTTKVPVYLKYVYKLNDTNLSKLNQIRY